MKFYLDEDISPRVAEILRKRGVNAVSAHDIGKTGASDEDQFAEAVSRKAAIVTRNRDDFITLTVQAFENTSPHYGLVVPNIHNGDADRSDDGDAVFLAAVALKPAAG